MEPPKWYKKCDIYKNNSVKIIESALHDILHIFLNFTFVQKLWENIKGWVGWPRGDPHRSPTKYKKCDIIMEFDIWRLFNIAFSKRIYNYR